MGCFARFAKPALAGFVEMLLRKSLMAAGLAGAAYVASWPALSQVPSNAFADYDKRIKSAEMVSPLKEDLFGDSVSLYNGATEFSAMDVDVPGNNDLPVRLGRRFSVDVKTNAALTSGGFSADILPLGGFGTWDIDVPYIHGMFDASYGWRTGIGAGDVNRCSGPALPRITSPFEVNEVFSGYHLRIPGKGDQELMLLGAANQTPTDGRTYRWGTRELYRARCTPSVANYPGEGFAIVDPEGTTYTFDYAITRDGGVVDKAGVALQRQQVFLMATRVEDRHGNYVTYSYSNGQLQSIESHDGAGETRKIEVFWLGSSISRVVAHGREWKYSYSPTMTVELPDHSTWTYEATGALSVTPAPPLDDVGSACIESLPDTATPFSMIITHPSGARGEFKFAYTRHGRSGTPASACSVDRIDPETGTVYRSLKIPDYSYTYSLVKKTITGPGLVQPLIWEFSWEDPTTGRAEFDSSMRYCGNCDEDMAAYVREPDGVKKQYVFGALWNYNEGRLLATYTRDANDNLVKSEVNEYVTEAEVDAGVPFPKQHGEYIASDNMSGLYNRPVKKTVITQDGFAFTNSVELFDDYARPLRVKKYNALYSRTDSTEYLDSPAKWVIGQVKKISNVDTGKELARTEFDPLSLLPTQTYNFGKLQQTLSYNADGTVASVKDGRNLTTVFSGWKRGIPQSIRYPATPEAPNGATQSAEVADNGTISWVLNEGGAKTCYSYDAIGRLSGITYPSETQSGVCDASVWNSTSIAFEKQPAAAYGLSAGYWRRWERTGNRWSFKFYDALWRPVVEEVYDAGNVAATLSQTVKRYDTNGRVAFQSYPSNGVTDYQQPLLGSRFSYDALGRINRTEQDSELGVLAMTTQYQSNLKVVTTNARNKVTTSTFMAWDQPSQDFLVKSEQPEGKVVEIGRHPNLGHPVLVRQRDSLNSIALTRNYVYDDYQQLCKLIEPESGATVTDYDGAGNILWTAAGLAVSSTTDCSRDQAVSSASKVARQYDARNRLSTLTFTDGRGNQTWTYWPDGRVQSIVTANEEGQTTNGYGYNKRGLPTTETLTETDGGSWSMGYEYDRNASISAHKYPSNRVVDYAPDALGRPSKAGAFASGVAYYPNGGMSQFTYGNGVVHSLQQNLRGLPDRSLDIKNGVAVLDDGYDYDANGNVVAISDGARAGRGNRDLGYDGLDRLTSATSPMFGGATYNYDALDNLTRVKVNGRDQTYYYDSAWRLTNVINTATGASVIGLGYDPQGNLNNKNGKEFRFDYGNRLRAATGVETYRYDGHGRRVFSNAVDKGTIFSFYGVDGVLRYQRDQRQAKAVDHIYLNGSLVARVSDAIAPFTPKLTVPGYSTTGSFAVEWSAIAGATSYEVHEASNGGAWQALYAGASLSQSVSGRSTANYSYRARACNSAGCGAWSPTATVAVELPPSGTPNLTAPSLGASGNYSISWTSAAGANAYRLEQNFNGGGWAIVYDGAAMAVSFTARPAGTYQYRVRGCNPAGCAGYSNVGTVSAVYPPATPTLSVPASNYGGSYAVTLGAVPGADYYQIDERFNAGAWTQIHNSSTTSVSLSGRITGTYGYRGRACNQAGCSAYSSEASVSVLLPPPATSIAAPSTNLGGSYSVSWATSSTATSYQLEERPAGGNWVLYYQGSSTSSGVSGRTTGTYEYRARACNAAGCSGYSGVASVAVTTIPPPSSINTHHKHLVFYGQVVQGSCAAGWNSSAGSTYYNVKAYPNGSMFSSSETFVSGGLSEIYCASSLVVQACNAAGCSVWSSSSQQTVTEEHYDDGGVPP